MSAALLDVNVLVAIFDPDHINHEDAHQWFERNHRRGWATCAATLHACARIISNPAYPVEATGGEVYSRLRKFCHAPSHQFWIDDINPMDPVVFRHELIAGHKQITDLHLLALAVRNRGKLATFDRSIPLKAVIGASASHIELLGAHPA